MSTTSTTASASTSSGATTSASSILTNIESALSADWQRAVAFFQQGEQDVMSFLNAVASGGEILISDIEAAAQYVLAHLGVINATITAVSTAASTIAPGNAAVAKVVADLQTGAQDVAALATAINSGTVPSGSSSIVTTAVSAVNAVQTLSSLAGQAAASIAQLTASSSTATQTVSQPTPNEG